MLGSKEQEITCGAVAFLAGHGMQDGMGGLLTFEVQPSVRFSMAGSSRTNICHELARDNVKV
jgi:hypothetical protein